MNHDQSEIPHHILHLTTSPQPPAKQFQCVQCQRTFGRIEHLTRHSRSHMRERNLKCSQCRKGFYRIDALKRHEQVHQEAKRVIVGMRARACIACADARRKCSGETPCTACERRATSCNYPKARVNKGISSEVNHESYQSAIENIPSPHSTTTHWSDSATRPKIQEHLGPRHFQSPENVQQQRRNGGDGYSERVDTSNDEPGYDLGQSRPLLSGCDSPQDLRSSTFATYYGSPSEELSIKGLDIDNQSLSHGGGAFPMPWFDSSSFSINWLPDNWEPDFQFGNTYQYNQQHADEKEISMINHIRVPNTNSSVLGDISMWSPGNGAFRGQSILQSHDIPSPDSQTASSLGHFYVDGDGARLPRVRRVPYRVDNLLPLFLPKERQELQTIFTFPDIRSMQGELDPKLSNRWKITQETYDEILVAFKLTCLTSTHHPSFQTEQFPSLEVLSYSIQLQFENFQPILPFLHIATFELPTTNWLLILALAAIGSHYFDIDESERLAVCLHEFTRRSVQVVNETGKGTRINDLVMTQVKLLNSIGMIYCGDERLKTSARDYHNELASFCVEEWKSSIPMSGIETRGDMNSPSNNWRVWVEAETRRRTGYSIWLLDCMWAFNFQTRPQLSLENAIVDIPCQEVLWEAKSALDWGQLHESTTDHPSLYSAIQLAYVEKRIQSSTGEFARVLCIHALFRRTWEVESYFSDPLSLWTPTAEKQNISAIENSMQSWLPANPTFSKWRNSACDVLDILHWHANSVIGATSGMEHPTVLHLHLARVILLTPYVKITRLARLMTGKAVPESDGEVHELRTYVTRWAREDQHKARLAIIHAGVLFWHVRRYSTDAFYESSSVYLATLALWAYGSFASHTSKYKDLPAEEEYTESMFPTSIQLDRPADDELVQLFVKRGDKMRANIMGVGDLSSARGPFRVLEQGIGLIAGLKRWGCYHNAIQMLRDLGEKC